MPRSANGKRKPEVFSVCDECGMFFGRKYELMRHADLHDPNVNKKKYLCPYDGCQHATLQRSNLKTHIDAKHTGIKAHQCRYEPCDVAFADPAYRLRHEKKYHNYRHKTDAGNFFVKKISMANAQVWMTPNVKIEEVPVVLDPISGPAGSSDSVGPPGPIARPSQQLPHTLKPPGRAQISIHEAALDDLRLRDLQQGSRAPVQRTVFKDMAYIPVFHPVHQSPIQSLFSESSRNVLLLAPHPLNYLEAHGKAAPFVSPCVFHFPQAGTPMLPPQTFNQNIAGTGMIRNAGRQFQVDFSLRIKELGR